MALNPYLCESCGHTGEYEAVWIPVPEEIRLYKGQSDKQPVLCPDCGAALRWVPRTARHDLTTGGTGTSIELDGKIVTFSSVHEMRKFSEESLARARNGEGQAIVFRCTEQIRGNMGRNTLAGSSYEKHHQIPHEQLKRTHRGLPIAAQATRGPGDR